MHLLYFLQTTNPTTKRMKMQMHVMIVAIIPIVCQASDSLDSKVVATGSVLWEVFEDTISDGYSLIRSTSLPTSNGNSDLTNS